MELKLEDYLSEDEIKEIVTDELKRHVRECVGNLSVSSDLGRVFVGKLAKQLAQEGVQEIIPNFKELINSQIKSEIKNVKLSNFFVSSFGWSSEGNKVLNSVLSDNKDLLDAKVKELFKVVDN